MVHVAIHSQVDSDGILRGELRMGTAEADKIVQVTVDSLMRPMTREEWERFVRSTAGTISDASFKRHPESKCRWLG